MREQKYANILDDYPEEVVEEIKDNLEELETDTETKLSMTRELKFKEIHDALDAMESALDNGENEILEEKVDNEIDVSVVVDEVVDSTKEVEIEKEEIHSTTDENDILDEVKKNKKRKKEHINEDLYLTASFKPFKKRFRMKKVFKVLFSLILTLVIVGLIGLFVVWPLYKRYFESQPKAIFDASLNYIGKQANNILDMSYVESSTFDYEYIFDIKSNIEGFDDFTNNKFGIRTAVDSENEKMEAQFFVLDDKSNRYGYSLIDYKDYSYHKLSNSDLYMKEKNSNEELFDYEEFKELLDTPYTKENLSYYISANINILKEIITEDLLIAEKDEIEIDGKSINVTRNSLELDAEKIKKLEKLYSERVLKDEKLLKIEAEFMEVSIEEVKESYKETGSYDDDYTLVINIYTVKGNKFVGFDIEENGFRNIYYYTNEGDFDAHINLTDDEDCNEGKDCNIENQVIIDLIGTKKDDYTEVEIRYNDDDVGTLDVREFNLEKIDFSYKIIVSDLVFEGFLKVEIDSKNNIWDIRFSTEFNDEYIELGMSCKAYIDSVVGEINESKVVDYTDSLFEQEYEKLATILEEKELQASFDLLLSIFDNPDDYVDAEELEKNFEDIWA